MMQGLYYLELAWAFVQRLTYQYIPVSYAFPLIYGVSGQDRLGAAKPTWWLGNNGTNALD